MLPAEKIVREKIPTSSKAGLAFAFLSLNSPKVGALGQQESRSQMYFSCKISLVLDDINA